MGTNYVVTCSPLALGTASPHICFHSQLYYACSYRVNNLHPPPRRMLRDYSEFSHSLGSRFPQLTPKCFERSHTCIIPLETFPPIIPCRSPSSSLSLVKVSPRIHGRTLLYPSSSVSVVLPAEDSDTGEQTSINSLIVLS